MHARSVAAAAIDGVTAAIHLRRKGFGVVATPSEVRPSATICGRSETWPFTCLLAGLAAGKLMGFEDRVALSQGVTFTNDRSQYDAFSPSVWANVDDLEPLPFRLKEFNVSYQPPVATLASRRNSQPSSRIADSVVGSRYPHVLTT